MMKRTLGGSGRRRQRRVGGDFERYYLHATARTGASRHEKGRTTVRGRYGDALRLIGAATSCSLLGAC